MESLDRELTLEIPHNMNLDTFAAQFFTTATDTSRKAAIQLLNETTKATITTSTDPIDIDQLLLTQSESQTQQRSTAIGNKFLQTLGETLFGFGSASQSSQQQQQHFGDIPLGKNMDLIRNHIVIDSADFNAIASSDLQQQLEYDKFMNEIWIGIVLTLIIISLVFCICSCFLYHQFRQWKRNYRHNLRQALDIESVKLNPDADDPVPEYTLVSGLPSYEAALELMQKSPNSILPVGGVGGGGGGATNSNSSCLIVYPSLFNVFSRNEKDSCGKSSHRHGASVITSVTEPTTPQSPSIGGGDAVVTASATSAPALAQSPIAATTTVTSPIVSQNVKCQNLSRLVLHSIPSYEEATGCQPQQQQQQQHHHQQSSDTSTCLMKSPVWCEDTTRVLLMAKKN